MRLTAAAIAALLAATPLAAQSLADAARREKERRAKAGRTEQSPKAYSDADLKSAKGATATEGASPDSPVPPSGEEAAAPPERNEATWRDRADHLRSLVGQAEGRVGTLEADLERVRVDREPVTANIMDPQREQKRQAEIGRLQSEIRAARGAVERARKELADFEEEARRANIPPGWIRER